MGLRDILSLKIIPRGCPLNLAESLLEDLRSKDPSVRFAVLNRLEGAVLSGATLHTFRSLAERETDPGARLQMDLILQAADKKPFAESANRFQEIERILKEPKPDFFSLVIHLRQMSPAEGPLVIDLLRHQGLDGFPEEVLPFVLRLFRQYGATQDIPFIEELCRHANPRVLSAAIEALEKINPEDVKAFIVPMLVNSSPGIQSQAIRLLYRWDPAEALNHFELLLFSDDYSLRQTALFYGYFFPFPDIESLLLRFLSLEEDLGLLKKAGQLFIVNPSQNAAYRLADLCETCGGEKKRVLLSPAN